MLADGRQIAAGRQLLGWSQTDLAEKAGVSKPSIVRMEKDLFSVKDEIRRSVELVFDRHAMEFTPGGVQERSYKITHYDGAEGFRDFMWDVYNTSNDMGGDIRLFNAKPAYWHKWLGKEWYQSHAKRMEGISNKVTFHAISCENDDLFIANNFGEYRWFPKDLFSEKAFYAYGNKLGFLNFEQDTMNIFVIEHSDFADAFRVLFEIAWDNVAIVPSQQKEI